MNRREVLKTAGLAAGASLLPRVVSAQSKQPISADHGFRFCLNVSTIRGQQLGFVEEIELAAAVGYDGIEIWVPPLMAFVEEGGSLSDLKKRIDDLGIQVENAIGFAQWIVDDNDRRMLALEQARREMDLLAQLGCRRTAAPPAGATNQPGLDLDRAAERFRALVELGVEMGVIPQLEIWGFSQNLYRLSQVLYVATECGHPQTRILPDIFHLYKGGSDVDGLKLISGPTIEIFHLNDYQTEPSREDINDSHRIYPGDGIGPVEQVIKDLHAAGGSKVLSLELFNRDYWQQDAETVVRTGLEKMKALVAGAVG